MITLDVAAFRAQFSQFANIACASDAQINSWWTIATTIISPEECPSGGLSTAQRTELLMLVTAHIATIFTAQNSGNPTPQMVTAATVDKVQITIKPPPDTTQLAWWLNLTPYGQMAQAIMQMGGAGGFYFGGLPERNAIRRVYGGFGGLPPWGPR